jgi:hypothetical protein
MDFVRDVFKGGQKVGGHAFSDHMAAVARMKGKALDIPEPPKLPVECTQVWESFAALSKRRGGEMAASPIRYGELDAYLRLTGASLDPWEVDLLMEVDDEFIRHQADKDG